LSAEIGHAGGTIYPMRKDIFLFGAGLVVTALAVLYATNTVLWDILLGLGILGMAGSVIDAAVREGRYLQDRLVIMLPQLVMFFGAIIISIGLVWYLNPYPTAPISPSNIVRKLDQDQKTRMELALKLPPTEQYSFQLNSIISCEECELFAQDIRDFINGIPGWSVNGGPLLWPVDQYRRGIWLITKDDEQHAAPLEKVRAAFASAGITLMPSSSADMRPGTFVVVIGRPQS
jgi:hypothetical protein